MKAEKWNDLSDDEVIDIILNDGESACYEVLYRKYYHRVLDKCSGIIKDRPAAEELAEDIFSHTFEHLGSFRRISSFSSWLYSISYNRCIDYLRMKNKLKSRGWSNSIEIPDIIDENDNENAIFDYHKLMNVLEQVDPEEKALLMMKYMDNKTIKNISAHLGISPDAAKMRLKRARKKILDLYRKVYGG